MEQNLIQNRSFQFALDIIKLYVQMVDKKEYILSKQLLRSGTSIGANVEEAIAGQSKKDFLSKMNISLKESREIMNIISSIVKTTKCKFLIFHF